MVSQNARARGRRGALEAVGARRGRPLESSRYARLAEREEGQDHLLPERRCVRRARVRSCGGVRTDGTRARWARAVSTRGDARTARLDANGPDARGTTRRPAVVAD